MSRTEGSFKISGALEPRIASALDARTLVQTKAELTASGNFPYPYVGLEVYVISENKKYRFIGSDTTDINDWEEVGSGGGNSIQVDTLPTASIDELGNIYQYVGVTDANYTNGCFYECVSDGESTPTYSWEMKPTMPSLSSGGIDEIVNPLPTGGRVTGFTPIGTIIPMIAETAPLYYLKCDGATYNKADYPELAAHLLSMTNHSMYEVSGDDTKFKVPDLSGEFLRGTGTNSHANNGNGAAVGIHQDGTIQTVAFNDAINNNIVFDKISNNNYSSAYNADKILKDSSTGGAKYYTFNLDANNKNADSAFIARPTNTSVLYCIATKDIYIDARNLYSTTEKVVGEWISGETLYQKTYTFEFTSSNPTSISLDLPTNMKDLISFDGAMKSTAGASGYGYYFPISFLNVNDASNNSLVTAYLSGGTGKIIVACGQDRSGFSCWLTIQYTKTT